MNVGILGIDPGSHGGFSIVDLTGTMRHAYSFKNYTEYELVEFVKSLKETNDIMGWQTRAYIEQVHAMPRDGKVQAFSFGRNYGFWLGILTTLKIGYVEIPPANWQAALKMRVRGLEYRDKKRAIKIAAQKLYPELNLTLDTCDGVLIAEYGRRCIVAERKAVKG